MSELMCRSVCRSGRRAAAAGTCRAAAICGRAFPHGPAWPPHVSLLLFSCRCCACTVASGHWCLRLRISVFCIAKHTVLTSHEWPLAIEPFASSSQHRCHGLHLMIRWAAMVRQHQHAPLMPLGWPCMTPWQTSAATVRPCALWKAACRCSRLTAAACSTMASRRDTWMDAMVLPACMQASVSSSTRLHVHCHEDAASPAAHVPLTCGFGSALSARVGSLGPSGSAVSASTDDMTTPLLTAHAAA
jgi:hypothetical protein